MNIAVVGPASSRVRGRRLVLKRLSTTRRTPITEQSNCTRVGSMTENDSSAQSRTVYIARVRVPSVPVRSVFRSAGTVVEARWHLPNPNTFRTIFFDERKTRTNDNSVIQYIYNICLGVFVVCKKKKNKKDRYSYCVRRYTTYRKTILCTDEHGIINFEFKLSLIASHYGTDRIIIIRVHVKSVKSTVKQLNYVNRVWRL